MGATPFSGGAVRMLVLGSTVAHRVVTVGTTSVAILTSALANRRFLILHNFEEDTELFIGRSNVTATGSGRGLPLLPRQTYQLEVGPDLTLYAVAPSAGRSLLVFETDAV